MHNHNSELHVLAVVVLSVSAAFFCRRPSTRTRDAPFWRESIQRKAIISNCVDSSNQKGGVDVCDLRFNWVPMWSIMDRGLGQYRVKAEGRKKPFPINISCLRLIGLVVEWMINHWARAFYAWCSVKGETNATSNELYVLTFRFERTDVRAVNVRRVRIPVGIISLHLFLHKSYRFINL